MNRKVTTKSAPKETLEAPRREPIEVYATDVQRNRAGSVWSEFHVRFPEKGILDDLKEPGIWCRVQSSPNIAFKRFDEVRIIAFDASWMAHAVVAHASRTKVILSKPTVTKLPEQQEHLFQDDRYYVKFVGHGYAVFRKHDDQQMSPAVHDAETAKTVLLRQYPGVAA